MKFRNIVYILLMIFFITVAYLLIYSGVNTKTKVIVNYKEDSSHSYKVYLHENDIYDSDYIGMNQKYIADLVDNIVLSYQYNSTFDKDINGYYSYMVVGNLVAYEDDINDPLFQKEYTLMDLKATVLDGNELREIHISDLVDIDYDLYREELLKFSKEYGIDISGYLDVKVIIKENLEFKGIEKVNEDTKEMTLNIPLSEDTFRICMINDNNKEDSYYEFSKKERVNYLLILIGMFSLSIGLSFLGINVRDMFVAGRLCNKYQRELNSILEEYDDIIVNVKKFYNRKKYNLIYVDSFKELMDAYNKIGNPISFRETKKGEEATFLMTHEDSAWIYKLKNK